MNDDVRSPETLRGPVPPDLHWTLVLLFSLITFGIFAVVWMFVEASFVRRLRTGSRVLLYYALGFAITVVGALSDSSDPKLYFTLARIAGSALFLCGHFSLKHALEDYYNRVEKIDLQLSGVMTFFFNVIYFQYHLSKIRKWKRTGTYDLGTGRYLDLSPKERTTYTQSELDVTRNRPPQA